MKSRAEIVRGWDLFRLGAFAEAESLLSPLMHDLQAVRLLLWIAIRRGDAENKLYFASILAFGDDAELASVGRAHENVALATLGRDAKPWLAAPTKWAKAEMAYARALLAFMNGRIADIRHELSGALPHTVEQRVRYSQLRAWEPALVDDFISQARLLSHSLTLALKGNVDRTLVAIIAGSLALIVREVELGEISAHVDRLFGQIEWPADNTIYRFYAQWGIAWRRATKGEWIPAMRLLDDALAIAPDPMREGLIYADRARISRAVPEGIAADSSCIFAFRRFEAIDWSIARNDEALGVLTTMDVLAQFPVRARRLLDQATAVQVSRMVGGGHGRRFEAFRKLSLAYLTEGTEGFENVQAAYNIFKSIKYVHRAADCAIRAIELGGGARWRSRVERLVAPYPRSLTARQYELADAPINRIRGRRREVLNLLVTTDDTARLIGERLGMKEATVRVHTRDIYRFLNIDSRAQLVRAYLETHPSVTLPRHEEIAGLRTLTLIDDHVAVDKSAG